MEASQNYVAWLYLASTEVKADPERERSPAPGWLCSACVAAVLPCLALPREWTF